MNTHATNLLRALIDGLMNATPTPEIHAHQMLAAELKGAMQASPEFTLDTLKIEGLTEADCTEPTPDADGWVENSGVMPECEISAIRFLGSGETITNSKDWAWDMMGSENIGKYLISHYRPA